MCARPYGGSKDARYHDVIFKPRINETAHYQERACCI